MWTPHAPGRLRGAPREAPAGGSCVPITCCELSGGSRGAAAPLVVGFCWLDLPRPRHCDYLCEARKRRAVCRRAFAVSADRTTSCCEMGPDATDEMPASLSTCPTLMPASEEAGPTSPTPARKRGRTSKVATDELGDAARKVAIGVWRSGQGERARRARLRRCRLRQLATSPKRLVASACARSSSRTGEPGSGGGQKLRQRRRPRWHRRRRRRRWRPRRWQQPRILLRHRRCCHHPYRHRPRRRRPHRRRPHHRRNRRRRSCLPCHRHHHRRHRPRNRHHLRQRRHSRQRRRQR